MIIRNNSMITTKRFISSKTIFLLQKKLAIVWCICPKRTAIKKKHTHAYICPVDWGCRIYLLCRGVRLRSTSVLIWHWTIWWWGSSHAGALGNAVYPLLPSLPGPLWSGVVAPDRILSMSLIELNCVFMLNWIVWNWTAFWAWNCILMLNWIVWNRTVLSFNCV